MRILKNALRAVGIGLMAYVGAVIGLFFVDLLLAVLNLPTLQGWTVYNPPGEGNLINGLQAVSIVAGLSAFLGSLRRRPGPSQKEP